MKLQYLEATDSNGTELYLFQLEDNSFIAVPKEQIEYRQNGKWIDRGWHGDWQFETDGRGNCWKEFKCSKCNRHNRNTTPYCPWCGARMKGADDETD